MCVRLRFGAITAGAVILGVLGRCCSTVGRAVCAFDRMSGRVPVRKMKNEKAPFIISVTALSVVSSYRPIAPIAPSIIASSHRSHLLLASFARSAAQPSLIH
eukprot:2898863-Pyramimonas_sp.AAC.1